MVNIFLSGIYICEMLKNTGNNTYSQFNFNLFYKVNLKWLPLGDSCIFLGKSFPKKN